MMRGALVLSSLCVLLCELVSGLGNDGISELADINGGSEPAGAFLGRAADDPESVVGRGEKIEPYLLQDGEKREGLAAEAESPAATVPDEDGGEPGRDGESPGQLSRQDDEVGNARSPEGQAAGSGSGSENTTDVSAAASELSHRFTESKAKVANLTNAIDEVEHQGLAVQAEVEALSRELAGSEVDGSGVEPAGQEADQDAKQEAGLGAGEEGADEDVRRSYSRLRRPEMGSNEAGVAGDSDSASYAGELEAVGDRGDGSAPSGDDADDMSFQQLQEQAAAEVVQREKAMEREKAEDALYEEDETRRQDDDGRDDGGDRNDRKDHDGGGGEPDEVAGAEGGESGRGEDGDGGVHAHATETADGSPKGVDGVGAISEVEVGAEATEEDGGAPGEAEEEEQGEEERAGEEEPSRGSAPGTRARDRTRKQRRPHADALHSASRTSSGHNEGHDADDAIVRGAGKEVDAQGGEEASRDSADAAEGGGREAAVAAVSRRHPRAAAKASRRRKSGGGDGMGHDVAHAAVGTRRRSVHPQAEVARPAGAETHDGASDGQEGGGLSLKRADSAGSGKHEEEEEEEEEEGDLAGDEQGGGATSDSAGAKAEEEELEEEEEEDREAEARAEEGEGSGNVAAVGFGEGDEDEEQDPTEDGGEEEDPGEREEQEEAALRALRKPGAGAARAHLVTVDMETLQKEHAELARLREVLASERKRNELERSKLQAVSLGVRALVSRLNGTKLELRGAMKEVTQREAELTSLKQFADKEKHDLEEIMSLYDARVDWESGTIVTANGTRYTVSEALEKMHKLRFKTGHAPASSHAAPPVVDPAVLQYDFSLLQDIVTLLGAAALGGVAAAFARMPPVVGYLVGGTVVGPTGLRMLESLVQVETLAQFGSVFLLFGHGMSYYAKDKFRYKLSASLLSGVLVAVLNLVFILAVGHATAVCASATEAFFFGAASSLSSTAVVLEHLRRQHQAETPYGRELVGMLGAQDLLMGFLLSLPSALGRGLAGVLTNIVFYCLALGATLAAARRLMPTALLLFKNRSNELFLLFVVCVCLGQSILAEWVGLSLEFGAFLAGLLFTESRQGHRALTAVEPLANVFGGLFFAAIGTTINPGFIFHHGVEVTAIIGIVVLSKLCIVFGVLRITGFAQRTALIAGASMAQIGEFSMLFMSQAQTHGLISRHLYLLTLSSTVIMMVGTPQLLHALPFDAERALSQDPRSRQRGSGGAARQASVATPGPTPATAVSPAPRVESPGTWGGAHASPVLRPAAHGGATPHSLEMGALGRAALGDGDAGVAADAVLPALPPPPPARHANAAVRTKLGPPLGSNRPRVRRGSSTSSSASPHRNPSPIAEEDESAPNAPSLAVHSATPPANGTARRANSGELFDDRVSLRSQSPVGSIRLARTSADGADLRR